MEAVQGLVILALPFLGGWAGARLFGAKNSRSMIASFISVACAALLALILGFGVLPIVAGCAVAALFVGVAMRMKPNQVTGLALGVAIPAFAVSMLAAYLPGFAANANAQLYDDCSSMKPEVMRISEENRQQNAGVYIIGIVEESSLSHSNNETRCRGTALFSDATRAEIEYRSYVEYDQWWIEYRPGA